MWLFALSMGACAAAAADTCPVQLSGFVTLRTRAGGWSVNGEYTLNGEHDGKPMYQNGVAAANGDIFVIAYSSRCGQYILSSTRFLQWSASFCRCDRPAEEIEQCATTDDWTCSSWLGDGRIEVSCAAYPESAHSAARSRSEELELMMEPPEPLPMDVEADVACNTQKSFSFEVGQEERYEQFNLATASDVTLSNCHTSFDTILKLWSHDRRDELSQSLGGCDGDDCECADCPDWHNEQFSIDALPAGTYYLQIGAYGSDSRYGGFYGGDYNLSITCAASEPIDPEQIAIAPHANLSITELEPPPLMMPEMAAARSRSEQEEEPVEMYEVTCGARESFSFADNDPDRLVRFRLDKTCDVTVSNCDTSFDTTLKMWSEDESEELSQTLGHCGGDDCFCSARDGNAYNEQFSIDALAAGTYVLQIGTTHRYPAYETGAYVGQYVLNIECSECSPSDTLSSALLSAVGVEIDADGVRVSLRALVVAMALIICVAMALVARRRKANGYAKVQVFGHSEAEQSLDVAE